MPTFLRFKGYRFFVYSNEGTEPRHVHVEKAEALAKFWLEPIELHESDGFSAGQLREVRGVIRRKRAYLIEKWNEYFQQ